MTIHSDYPCNPGNYAQGRTKPIQYLVYHYVGATGGAAANARYYHNIPGIGASAHYFVGHASEGAPIYASVAEGNTAWHCGRSDRKYKHPYCRNANSIGIEMCCHKDAKGTWYIDEETMAAAAALGREIMARYNIPLSNVVRHYDVTGKLCPRPLIDEGAWASFKKRLEDDDTMDQSTFDAMLEDALARRAAALEAKPASDWAAPVWQAAKDAELFDGTKPLAPLTREQAAVVFDRLGLIGK